MATEISLAPDAATRSAPLPATHAAVNRALATGYGVGFEVAAGIALVGFAIAAAVVRRRRAPQTARAAEATAA